METRYKLMMLAFNIDGPAIIFGENQNVVISSTNVSMMLMKKHNALAY